MLVKLKCQEKIPKTKAEKISTKNRVCKQLVTKFFFRISKNLQLFFVEKL